MSNQEASALTFPSADKLLQRFPGIINTAHRGLSYIPLLTYKVPTISAYSQDMFGSFALMDLGVNIYKEKIITRMNEQKSVYLVSMDVPHQFSTQWATVEDGVQDFDSCIHGVVITGHSNETQENGRAPNKVQTSSCWRGLEHSYP